MDIVDPSQVRVPRRLSLWLSIPLTGAFTVVCWQLRARSIVDCTPLGNGASPAVILATMFAAFMLASLVTAAIIVRFTAPAWIGLIVVTTAMVGGAYLYFWLSGPIGHGDTYPGCVDLVPTWWPRWLPARGIETA